MRRAIIPTKPLTGGQSQNWKVKSTRGDTTVPAASSSMPVGGAGSSATASSTSSRGSAENSLMDDLRKALEIFKKKLGVTETVKARMDTNFKKLLEGIRQGSSKDVSDALISLEAISKCHRDANLIHLVKEIKEEQCDDNNSPLPTRVTQDVGTPLIDRKLPKRDVSKDGQSYVIGTSERSSQSKLNTAVNQWLSALKSDIEIGQFTASFEGDTSIELTTTKELLQDIARSLKTNAEREHKLREDYTTLKSQKQDTEHKILSIWKLFGSGTKSSPQLNSSDALSEFGRLIAACKQSSDAFRFIEENANLEINLLKQDIENLQDEKRSSVIRETQTDPALVRSLKQLRKELLLKKKKITEAMSTVSQKNASETQRMHAMGSDELRSNVTDVCAFCATDEKLNPALYFCKDCSKFGRYICGICNKNHDRFTNNHNVERISTT